MEGLYKAALGCTPRSARQAKATLLRLSACITSGGDIALVLPGLSYIYFQSNNGAQKQNISWATIF